MPNPRWPNPHWPHLRWPLALGLGALSLAGCAPGPLLPPGHEGDGATVTAAPSSPSGDSLPSAADATPVAAARCALADELTPAQQVGQLFMMGVDTSGLGDTARAAIVDGRIGSVVLLGNTTAGQRSISSLVAEVTALGTPEVPVLVAVDQEGGRVQRLKGQGFSSIPNAQMQGEMPSGELRSAARSWGQELRRAGVRYNLAPVADVVPQDKVAVNAPIGQLRRNFGTDEATVGRAAAAFVEGMNDAGVATSLKHFPGLGRVTENTDFDVAVDTGTTASAADLSPFVAGIAAGADSVMVSSAIYQQIDPDSQGVFSRIIITDVLRGELGFDGVVISDDLGAAEAVSDVSAADRATRFFTAGGDLLINADPSHMAEMTAAVSRLADKDPAFAEQIHDSAVRVLLLKEKTGLVDCSG
ncbi:MAG TPA: glycoside hydrolase family 3 N-terminal domain-containing protein [Arachnia sp.]|nr:glycoside hydrolase family 3 N-terminal domain-containing protein [Arachnia sp.]HMT87641.1 glycoside hydrolase family 3 N-terminal domain-containing protein [Arachnia sp.]